MQNAYGRGECENLLGLCHWLGPERGQQYLARLLGFFYLFFCD
uniref:Uncharacterized protein n=1 Tax=Anguilla anguilla TaxID=7936 RepID=A0A0E9U1N0_ANGAN